MATVTVVILSRSRSPGMAPPTKLGSVSHIVHKKTETAGSELLSDRDVKNKPTQSKGPHATPLRKEKRSNAPPPPPRNEKTVAA